jgi:hypothetical protein
VNGYRVAGRIHDDGVVGGRCARDHEPPVASVTTLAEPMWTVWPGNGLVVVKSTTLPATKPASIRSTPPSAGTTSTEPSRGREGAEPGPPHWAIGMTPNKQPHDPAMAMRARGAIACATVRKVLSEFSAPVNRVAALSGANALR